MKDYRKISAVTAALVSVCMIATGCAGSSDNSVDTVKSEVNASSSAGEASNSSSSGKGRQSQSINIEPGNTEENSSAVKTASTAGQLDTSDLFTDRDLEQTADLSEAKVITVADGKTIDITAAGVYVLTGTAEDCTVRVDVDSSDKVQLVLDNVSIENSGSPAIYVVSADKCFITTSEGSTNSLSVTGEFKADGDTNTDAVIFSKDDLVLNGKGTLKISSAKGNGISGKDDLKITGGSYSITSEKDSIEANDSIRISGGSFEISSSKDGLHSENDDDNSVGWIYISGGDFKITSKSDGIQATTFLRIDGGSFDITSAEGLEATYVRISGGEIEISATDDGVNATAKSKSESVFFEMTDGKLKISMGNGDVDAIDVNGSLSVSGGTIDITCPEQGSAESFDYDGSAEFTGGTIIVNGEQQDSIPTPQMMGGGFGGFGGGGGKRGNFGENGNFPNKDDLPEDMSFPDRADLPEGVEFPNMEDLPEGFDFPNRGDRQNGEDGNMRGGRGGRMNRDADSSEEESTAETEA